MHLARTYKLICEETANRVEKSHTLTRRWVPLDAYGKPADDEKKILRRSATGWLRVFANVVIPEGMDVFVATATINDDFRRMHGKALEDVSYEQGGKAAARCLRELGEFYA